MMPAGVNPFRSDGWMPPGRGGRGPVNLNAPRKARSVRTSHHPIVTPCPAAAEVELLCAAGRGVRVVKTGWSKDHTQLAQQVIEDIVAVREAGEFDSVPVYVQYNRFLTRDDQLSKIAQFRGIAPEE